MAKIISINVNGSNFLEKIIPFLKKENPDIVCFQEMIESNIPLFEKELNMSHIFAPMVYGMIRGDSGLAGVAIFSKYPMMDIDKYYYRGTGAQFQTLREDGLDLDMIHTFIQNVVLSAKIIIDQKEFVVATTHGTWTPYGKPAEYQLKDFDRMLNHVKKFPEILFMGDFNASRGEKSFQLIAQVLKDNIPITVKTSLDEKFHRAPVDQRSRLMVDGFFSTEHYVVTAIHLVDGVSDHKAIVAHVQKTN